jgi:NTE family protein
VVVGSGGVKCAAALGLWSVLQREGIEVTHLVGASGGSIYAAIVALGWDRDFAQRTTARLWTTDLVAGYPARLRATLTGKSRFTERSGLIDDQLVRSALHKVFEDRTFEDLERPLYIVSTDLHSGKPVVHTSGVLLDVIMASIAIPLLFPPQELDGRLLVDGAVSNPLPVDIAIREGGEIVLAMGFEMDTRPRLRSYSAVTSHFSSLYMNNILRASYAFASLAHHGEVIPIFPQFEHQITTFDSTHLAHVIDAGAAAAEEQLPYLRRLLARGE